MPKYSKAQVEESRAKLREWIKPGDTIHTVLDHVSSSGMTRHIRLMTIYMMQGGRTEKPDPNKPGTEWFGAAGYALKHRWL